MTAASDARWLAAAARLALKGRPASNPNPAVGCIIVKDGRVVGRGWTQAGGRPHAEAMALDMAGEAARGADVYATLEPCAHRSPRGPSCADRLVEAGVARLIAGVVDPDDRTAGLGLERLRKAGIDAQAIACPHSAASLAGYLTRQRHGRPHVTLKLAMSLDGCIALADGTSQWITGEASRAHVHSRRALADAILVGGGTWRTDNPRLDVRLPGLDRRSPERWVLTTQAIEGVQTIAAPADITRIPAQYLYVEGGAQTAASFLAEDLVDRLEIYRAPILIGDGLRAIGGLGLAELARAHDRWQPVERRSLGPDSFEAFERSRQGD
ncbi:bifunctional diaminohydroxyphosphoribosylaminopyrimidine deaminase/5-amino-6-(5-phosphoribosylamino)uracil reductase RibD [Citromicrobium bathyomarinum]|uniref:bifunctional diaminohydroxyphosphoribosylaminopyrimidine deaminase/5-amino-6-(5-phosphoribosylamino)uracil reductase RibD n=1 Tax=Citromicrobium bathyomarinum TaxID=72174 RepID=UPI00315AF319